MYIPNAPMQFISLDIAYLPKDHSGNQCILMIGDIFSKFVQAVPLKNQTAPVIADALLKHWILFTVLPFTSLLIKGLMLMVIL